MREINIKLYTFDELSSSAKSRAWEEWASTTEEFTDNDEYRATLEAFEKLFDVKVYRWCVDENHYNYRFSHIREAPEGDWLRFAKWVWNNYGEAIQQGKYYGKLVYREGMHPRHVKRYSKATVEYTCNLTGFVADMDITDPVWKCIHYKEKYTTYDELIEACLESFFEAWRNAMEYETSIYYFEELCELNEWEFTEYGEMWRGI